MTSGTAHVWVRSADGELTRSDVIIGLRCHGGEVEAVRQDGSMVRLAGPGCPPGFDLDFLRVLERQQHRHDDRWIVVISYESTANGAPWIDARLDELGEAISPAITGDRLVYRSCKRSTSLVTNVPRPCRVMIRPRSCSTCIAFRRV